MLQEPPNALDVSNTTTSDLFSNVSQPPSNVDQSNVDQSNVDQSNVDRSNAGQSNADQSLLHDSE